MVGILGRQVAFRRRGGLLQAEQKACQTGIAGQQRLAGQALVGGQRRGGLLGGARKQRVPVLAQQLAVRDRERPVGGGLARLRGGIHHQQRSGFGVVPAAQLAAQQSRAQGQGIDRLVDPAQGGEGQSEPRRFVLGLLAAQPGQDLRLDLGRRHARGGDGQGLQPAELHQVEAQADIIRRIVARRQRLHLGSALHAQRAELLQQLGVFILQGADLALKVLDLAFQQLDLRLEILGLGGIRRFITGRRHNRRGRWTPRHPQTGAGAKGDQDKQKGGRGELEHGGRASRRVGGARHLASSFGSSGSTLE